MFNGRVVIFQYLGDGMGMLWRVGVLLTLSMLLGVNAHADRVSDIRNTSTTSRSDRSGAAGRYCA